MSDRITEAFDTEIADLQARLDRVVKARAEWLRGSAINMANAPSYLAPKQNDLAKKLVAGIVEKYQATNKQIIAEVQKLLAGRASPTSLSEIFQFLEILGIQIGGKTPKNTLSAMLSTSGVFKSHGRAGWTLKAPQLEPVGEDHPFAPSGEYD